MEILNSNAITQFAQKHPLSRKPLSRWIDICAIATWNNILDIQRHFKTAEDVKGYVVFNIHGNDYRLIARVNYKTKRVFILHILTHVEYSKGDWKR